MLQFGSRLADHEESGRRSKKGRWSLVIWPAEPGIANLGSENTWRCPLGNSVNWGGEGGGVSRRLTKYIVGEKKFKSRHSR